ncbi:hypothetical protein FE257_003747 [Aspergillus nanangensis]|uniref:Uncharacterized protein n=1 Tax=Aspergillus nanangensis TaxID=2582783 RepID=A0AAD4CBB8_ASPNN|nr:hypothetical protein FE257_003747 [Aspergillus nanangensis]
MNAPLQSTFSVSLLSQSRVTNKAYGLLKEGAREGEEEGEPKELMSSTPRSVSIYRPQLEKDTFWITTLAFETPFADFVSESHSLTVSSIEQDAANWLSGENAMEFTGSASPLIMPHCAPVLLQNLIVLSSEQDMSNSPLDEKATELTGPE